MRDERTPDMTSTTAPASEHAPLAEDMHRAEEALRASEERYRRLLEHAPVAIYVHDGTNVVFANDAFAAIMGATSPQALIGYPVARIAHPDEVPRLLERVRAVEEGLLVSPRMAFRVMRLDGQVVSVLVMATKCLYEGRPAIQVVMVDETERLRAESEREALEVQLKQAQRLEALGTLASGIAHDFNNFLAVIMSNAELARSALPPEHESRGPIDDLLLATDRAAALVRSILAFGRERPLARVSMPLDALVHEAARLVRATLPSAVVLDVDAGASDACVLVDATQFHQVLLNLCTNAWHSMRSGTAGRIRIGTSTVVIDEPAARVHPDLGVGRYLCVSVRDNGSGMDAATAARVFDPFFTTKAPGAGSGLGLSVVHGIMRGHGGAVTVTSEPGVGTELRLYFPVAPVSVTPEARTSDSAGSLAAGRHALLADDERALLSVARRSLERLGLRVTAHSTLAGALAALREDAASYDLIVTDHNMSDGSGLDLVRAARELRADVPVVLMSGYLNEGVLRDAAELGVGVFLSKPFSVAQLTASVQQALEGTQAISEPEKR